MAALVKKKGSENWYTRFMHEGVEVCGTTGKRKKKDAKVEMVAMIARYKGQTRIPDQVEYLIALISALPSVEARQEERKKIIIQLNDSTSSPMDFTEVW